MSSTPQSSSQSGVSSSAGSSGTSLTVAQRRAMFGGGQATTSTVSPSPSASPAVSPIVFQRSNLASPVKASATHSLGSPSTGSGGILMSPHSSGGSHATRFQTMLPLGLDVRQAIPPSSAPDHNPDANRIFAGMNVGVGREEARKKFWSAAIAAVPVRPSKQDLDTSQLSDAMLAEIEMELEVGHFSRFVPELAPRDFDALRRLLQREAVVNERETLGIGYAHMAARLLLACERDEARTLDLLCLVAARLRTYESDVPLWSLLRNDVLRLADILISTPTGAQLCGHFNSVGFDLVDLSDVIVTWFGGLFCAAAFPTEFSLRCVDLLLLSPEAGGGCTQIVCVLYGLLHVIQMKLMECPNSEALFTALQDLPSALTKAQIGEVFAQAYWTVWAPSQKAGGVLPQPEVEWSQVVDLSGALRFQPTAMMKALIGGVATDGQTLAMTAALASATSFVTHAPVHISPPRTSGGAGGNGATPGHAHSTSMTFNLGDYSPDTRRSIISSDATTAAGGATSASDVSDATAVAPVVSTTVSTSTTVTTLRRQSITPATPPTISASAPVSTTDPTLLAELSAATSGNKSAAQLQTLLERALKELKVQTRAAAAASAAAAAPPIAALPAGAIIAPVAAFVAAPSVATTGTAAGATPAASDATLGVRNLASTIHQIPPLEVHSLSVGGTSATKKVVPSSGVIKYSELLEYQLYPSLCMQGYLMKSRAPSKLFKRRGSSGFFGNLHRRFFHLQGNFLTYFKTHDYTKPTRDESVDMRTCVVTRIKNHEFAPFAFQVHSREKGSIVYLLFANSETVRDVWIECLAQASGVPALGV